MTDILAQIKAGSLPGISKQVRMGTEVIETSSWHTQLAHPFVAVPTAGSHPTTPTDDLGTTGLPAKSHPASRN